MAASAAFLTACQGGSVPEPGPEMGNATPASSPASTPDGDVIMSGTEFSDLVVSGETIAARTDDSLHIGTLEQFRDESAHRAELDPACADLTAAVDAFVLACGGEVLQFSAADPASVKTWPTEAPATSAVIVDGRLITGNTEETEVTVYADGEDPETIGVAETTDQMISVPQENGPDSVVLVNRANTTIQDVDWEGGRQGGTLRVGVGVGQAAPGEGGVVVVADTLAPQIAIYTAHDVIRLQQTAPVDDSPWGAAWDPGRKLAWVSSTAENTATGHDISNGVPIATHSINTVADAHNIAFLPDGTFIAASASGEGLQIVDEPAGI